MVENVACRRLLQTWKCLLDNMDCYDSYMTVYAFSQNNLCK